MNKPEFQFLYRSMQNISVHKWGLFLLMLRGPKSRHKVLKAQYNLQNVVEFYTILLSLYDSFVLCSHSGTGVCSITQDKTCMEACAVFWLYPRCNEWLRLSIFGQLLPECYPQIILYYILVEGSWIKKILARNLSH